jgi:hypothetical protein
MSKTKVASAVLASVLCCGASFAALAPALARVPSDLPALRPPAVPLVTFDPFLSIWSESDKLTGDATRHWTHREHPLISLIRIDGKTFRLMGAQPSDIPALDQTGVSVLPTRTLYTFAGQGLSIKLTFMTPALPEDLRAFSLPLSYVTWDVSSADGAKHNVQVFLSASALLAVDDASQRVVPKSEQVNKLIALRVGTADQKTLRRAGDDSRIDWGYAYLSTSEAGAHYSIDAISKATSQFSTTGTADNTVVGRDASRTAEEAMAVTIPLGNVGAEPVSRHAVIAYDEDYAIKFFGKDLRPYWNKDNIGALAMLADAEKNYASLVRRCEAFDAEVMADAVKVGGAKYAQMVALAYRQAAAGCGLAADANGQPMFFTKENTSNGDIATVDVIFPMDPVWLLFSPTLAKATLAPVMAYAASDRWTFPCSPHDLGTYPIARGTDDGGEAMPVEESGNMLLLVDAIAQRDGNTKFIEPWWPLISKWAAYLQQFGLDPENQLCTDDFMGHLAHNSNLSVKAILALAAYGDLCRMRGDYAEAEKYAKLAKADAAHWMKVANEGDHSVLAFDKPNTWSQKYNLVWDRVLGLNVFPPELPKQEIAFYKAHLKPYGLPLDSRTNITKTDWTLWSASLADDNADFETIISPLYTYLNTTGNRVPFTDGYDTTKLNDGDLFHARPVIGGVFIKLLADGDVWKKWAARDKQAVGGWMTVPNKPVITEIVPTAKTHPEMWRYTTDKPAGNWMSQGFDASAWKTGLGGFGTQGTPGAVIGTVWSTDDIYVRRIITVPAGVDVSTLKLRLHHDEDADVYINGVKATTEPGFIADYETFDISPAALAALKPGKPAILAIHCHQTVGGQYIDAGLVTVTAGK